MPDSQSTHSAIDLQEVQQYGGFRKSGSKFKFSEQPYSKCPARDSHTAAHLLALRKVRNTAETLQSISRHSLRLCSPNSHSVPQSWKFSQ